MNTLMQAALDYQTMGFSVVPVRNNKRAAAYWKKYQIIPMGPGEIQQSFRRHNVQGVAIVCGVASGQLEVIDLDCKNDLSGSLFCRFMEKLIGQLPEISRKLVIAKTRNQGYHFFYRCPIIGQNMPLARRAATSLEWHQQPGELVKVLIETRARGGYVVAEPTFGYRVLHGSLDNVPWITAIERAALFGIAKSFNSYQAPVWKPRFTLLTTPPPASPLSAYDQHPNRRENLIALLEKHHWITVRTNGLKTYFRRPGKSDHDTSGDYHHDLNLFGVFSTSTLFTPGQTYRPSAVYALLECQGDFRLAAKRLVQAGFGTPYRKRAA